MASFYFKYPIHIQDTTTTALGKAGPVIRSAHRVEIGTLEPPTVDFGIVASGTTRTLRIEAPRVPTETIEILNIRAEGPFRVDARDVAGRPANFPHRLHAGDSGSGALELDITFEPRDMGRSVHGLIRVELAKGGRRTEGRVRLAGAQVGLEPRLAATMAATVGGEPPISPEAR